MPAFSTGAKSVAGLRRMPTPTTTSDNRYAKCYDLFPNHPDTNVEVCTRFWICKLEISWNPHWICPDPDLFGITIRRVLALIDRLFSNSKSHKTGGRWVDVRSTHIERLPTSDWSTHEH